MKPSPSVNWIAGLLLAAGLLGSVGAVRQQDQVRSAATLQEVLYVTSPKTLKRMSLGYTGLVADLYWTRAVQYFGSNHHVDARRYDLLAPLLDLTTQMDPKLLVAYEFGASFLAPAPPAGAGMPDKAVELVERGIEANPNEWRLYHSLGFIHYMDRKDYAAAADAFARGSRVPNAHPWLRLLAARMAQNAGNSETARMMWAATYDTSQDKMVKANAAAHLRALQVEGDVDGLEKIVAVFQERNHRLPAGFHELTQQNLLLGTPLDPLGQPYILSREGRVEVRNPDRYSFLTRGLPAGYESQIKPKLDME